MFHLGQKVLLKGEPCIYGGVDLVNLDKNRGMMFIHKDGTVQWLIGLSPDDVRPVRDADGEVVVGKFCKETDLYGFFFGVLDIEKLDQNGWRLIKETLS